MHIAYVIHICDHRAHVQSSQAGSRVGEYTVYLLDNGTCSLASKHRLQGELPPNEVRARILEGLGYKWDETLEAEGMLFDYTGIKKVRPLDSNPSIPSDGIPQCFVEEIPCTMTQWFYYLTQRVLHKRRDIWPDPGVLVFTFKIQNPQPESSQPQEGRWEDRRWLDENGDIDGPRNSWD